MRYCIQCGQPIEEDARFCGHCGAAQPAMDETPQTESFLEGITPQGQIGFQAMPAEKKRPYFLIPIIAFLAVAVLAGGFFLLRPMLTSEENMDYEELENALYESKEAADLSLVSADASEFPVMKVYVSCEQEGEPLTLTSPTAKIRERINGGSEIERTVRSVEQLEDNQGIGIELLTDKSGSMEGDLGVMQQVMTDFIDNMDYAAGDKAEIISFDSYIMYMCDYTGDSRRLKNGISNMTAYGETALYDALVTGISNAGSRPGANCVIAFTDGSDNNSSHTYEEAIRLAQEKGIPVYIIGTSSADENVLQNITDQTGGEYWNVDDIYDVEEIYEEIYESQKDLYCIEYETDADSDAYAQRSISCILSDKNVGCQFTEEVFRPAEKKESQKHSSRYEIIREDISWTQANEKAHEKGGHLVTITSEDEERQIEGMAAKAGIKYVWIGGYTSVRDDTAFGHWTTGEEFSFTNWYPGEPSRNDRDGTPEFYMMLWAPNGNWSWNDQRDDVVHSGLKYFTGNVGFVIEYEE